ncbi:tubulin tyrosine ligase-like 3B [Haematobia irritans]|uniref:tubulin tyrosine ligase-like 3B n=1 Tax=Haematobia irritans TaxID=7368 RepID=UPI003F50A7B1
MSEKPESSIQTKILMDIYRARVLDAYRKRKIFTVFGNYRTVRQALHKRGWLEKLSPNRYGKLQSLPEEVLLQHVKQGNEFETVLISKLMNNFPAFFVWQPKAQHDLYVDVRPYRNRIRRSPLLDFTTKVGLIGCAEQQQWYEEEGVAKMLYPRFYRLYDSQEEQQFIEDFHLTQCRSFLRYLIRNKDHPEILIHNEEGSVSSNVVEFAIARLKRQLADAENIISPEDETKQVTEDEWIDFMMQNSKVLESKHKIKCSYRQIYQWTRTAENLLLKMDILRPDFKWDGLKNLWILKPGYQSRGLGIIIRNSLDEILRWSSAHTNRKYIIQKYIENPLLIYKTKFDIRQYMLVFIREMSVQIWLYRECYLRFSSQEYSVDDFQESIHLTNNSVQKKYKNEINRDSRLPKSNMWSLDQFKVYMRTQHIPEDVWERRISDGFRQNLIAVVRTSLDETSICENCFELYGCDFMLDEQYNPILIEINSTPDLSPSTEVTAYLCPMVIRDCIKVIVDVPNNSKASTGLFQKVYEVNYQFQEDLNMKKELNITGRSITLNPRVRKSLTQRIFKRTKRNNEVNVNKKGKQDIQKLPSIPYQKSKTNISRKMDQLLNTATKETLALRYTTPK